MTKKTRLFVGISVAVLIVGATAGFVASYYGLPGFSLQSEPGPDELAYLPLDSSVVAYANVRDVMNSDLRRRLTEAQPDGGQPGNEFESRTGINFERDVELVVASFAGADSNGRPLVIARGTFDQTRIETLLRGQGAQEQDYRGERIFVIEADGDGQPDNTQPGDRQPGEGQPMAISFVESGIVAAGTVEAVRRAIDTKAAGGDASVTDDEELMGMVRDMDQGTAWAVGRFDALAQGRLPEEVASRLPPISRFAVTGRINGGVEGLVRAETADDQGAQDLRQVIQGFMALARLQSGQNPQLTAILNSLQLGGQGRTVSLTFAIPADLIDALSVATRQRGQNAPDAPAAPQAPDAPVPPAVPNDSPRP
jgi:hypothetical protein